MPAGLAKARTDDASFARGGYNSWRGDIMEFQVGDVVRLKAGGPKMTVEAVEGQNVDCVWFDGVKVFRDTFPARALEVPAARRAVLVQY